MSGEYWCTHKCARAVLFPLIAYLNFLGIRTRLKRWNVAFACQSPDSSLTQRREFNIFVEKLVRRAKKFGDQQNDRSTI